MRVRDYTLEVRLGAGGMGEAWLASDAVRGKKVVLKTLLPEAAHFLDYFTSEAKLGAQLRHANLVNVLDFFIEAGRHYLVMEYVDGATLQALTERLTPAMAVYVAASALAGLDYAHNLRIDGRAARVVHRDISPDNILVSRDAEVKVTDFGIAKAEVRWRERTTGNPFKGKWGYVSPEMLLGQDVDRRADVYQMGVVLYELLAGARAFPSGSSTYHRASVIVEGKVRPLRELAPDAPNSLVLVVERMMHPERDHRMPTAEAARTALLNALPASSQAERPLAELVRRAGKQEGVIPSAIAAPDDTVPERECEEPGDGVPRVEIVDEQHRLSMSVQDEERESLHIVRRRLRALRHKTERS